MTPNPQLLYAILAMDVYHRGDAGGINDMIDERPTQIDDTVRIVPIRQAALEELHHVQTKE